jgi:hypothetical protein
MMRLGFVVTAGLALFTVMSVPAKPSFHVLAEGPLTGKTERPGSELVVRGVNEGAGPATVIVSIDDGSDKPYAERFNVERVVLPGPFAMRLVLGGLTTPSRRVLDPAALRAYRVFSDAETIGVTVESVKILMPPRFPADVLALDFGPADGPVFPGFQATGPDGAILRCARCRAVRRPYTDPLIADGIQGMTRITLPAAPGPQVLAMWTEDTGEWEYLPHFRERRIKINGRVVLQERSTTDEWVRERYLAGLERRHADGASAWDIFGRHRGGLIVVDVQPVDGKVVIDLAGEGYSATHMAALMLVPKARKPLIDQVQAERAGRFNEEWPIIEAAASPPISGPGIEAVTPSDVTVSRGAIGVMAFDIVPTPGGGEAEFRVATPLSGDGGLAADIYLARWRLARTAPSSRALVFRNDMLDGRSTRINVPPGRKQRVYLVLRASNEAPAGEHVVRFQATGNDWSRSADFIVKVPDAVSKGSTIGTYLEPLPPDTWFGGAGGMRNGCRMDRLAEFGISALAPMLRLPVKDGIEEFLFDLEQAGKRFSGPLLAYATVKRLVEYGGMDGAAKAIANLEKEIRARGLAAPVWSVADEPSNPGVAANVEALLEAIRRHAPEARLAAHLNHPQDMALAAKFDVVLVNPGFAMTAGRLAALRDKGVSVWGYNFPEGYALKSQMKRHGLDTYFQWHAAMPTADPFDPTDGREDDIFLIYPTEDPCPDKPVIHRRLLELAGAAGPLR